MSHKTDSSSSGGVYPNGEETFRLIFEGHSAIMLLVEVQSGNILNANQAAVDFYGYSKSKLCGMSINEINVLPPEEVTAERQKALNEERNYFIFPHRLASGETRIVEVHSSPVALHNKRILFSIIHDITDRKRAEEALEKESSRRRLLFEESPDGIVIIDPQTTAFLEFNTAAHQQLGYSREEFAQLSILDIEAMETADETRARIGDVIQSGKADFETLQRTRLGEVRNVHVLAQLINIDEHLVYYCVWRDITARKRAEKALFESDKRLQEVLENSLDASYKRDLRTNTYDYLSPVFARLSGYTVDELNALPVEMVLGLIHPDDQTKVNLVIAESASGIDGPAYQVEYRFKHKDGCYRWFHDRFTVMQDMQGCPTARIGSVSDITERKRSEEMIKELANEMQVILDTVTAGVSHLKDRKVEWANVAHDRMFGYAVGESRGLETSAFYPNHPSFEQLGQEAYVQLTTGKTYTSEMEMKRKDGTLFWCRFVGRAVNVERMEEGSIWMLEDITERKQMEEALRRRTDALAVLQEIILDISSPHSLPELLNLIVERAANFLDASSGGLYLTEAESRHALCVVSYKTKSDYSGTKLDFGIGAAGIVAETGQPIIIDDYSKWTGRADVYEEEKPFTAVMSAPMIWQGRVSGVIHLLRDNSAQKFKQEELDLLTLFANHAAVAVENARLFNLLESELSGHKMMAEALRVSDAKNHALIDAIPEMIFILDNERNFVDYHAAHGQLLLSPPEAFLGRNIKDVLPPEVFKGFSSVLDQVSQSGQNQLFEYSLDMSDGHHYYESHVVTYEGGGFLSVNREITERRHTEEALKYNEARYRALFESSLTGIFITRPDGTICDANPEACRMLGRTEEELRSLGRDSVINSADPHLSAALEERSRTGRIRGEFTFIRADGTTFPILGSSSLFTDSTGQIHSNIFFQDISDRKRMEDALRESEEKFRNIIEQSRDGIVLIDEEGVVIEWNYAYEQITGIKRSEAIGQPVWNVQFRQLRKERRSQLTVEHLKQSLLKILETGQSSHFNQSTEASIDTISGESKVILQNLFPIKTRMGYRVCGIILDITERKRVENELRASEERIRLIFETLSEGVALNEMVFDENGEGVDYRILQVNDAFYEIADFRKEGAVINKLATQLYGMDPQMIRNFWLCHRSAKQTIHTEMVSPINNRVFYVSTSPLQNNRFVTSFQDITDRKQVEEKLQRQNEYLSALHQITLDLLDHRSMDDLLQAVVEHAVILLDAPFGEVMLEKNGKLCVQTCTENQSFLKGDRVGRGAATLSWSAFDTKQPVVLDDYSAYSNRRNVYENQVHAVAEFPVLVRDKCIGVLAMGRSQAGYVFSEEQVKNGMLFAQLVALVLDNAQLFSTLEYEVTERKQAESDLRHAKDELELAFAREQELARIDTLTGINNRRYLLARAEHEIEVAVRYEQPLAVILFDVDYFKRVNDTFGHATGDQILKQVAEISRSELRKTDVIGRYGGEEFVAILPVTNAWQAFNLAERIRVSVEALRVSTEKGDAAVTLSIGIVEMFSDTKIASIEDLIRHADEAMYKAKEAGRNCIEISTWNNAADGGIVS